MHDLIGLMAVVAPFVMVVLIIVLPAFFKSRERREMQSTVRAAIERGQELPADLVEAIGRSSTKAPATAHSDLRAGVIWLAIGLGLATFGLMMAQIENEVLNPLIGLASIPAFIGLAFIVLSVFNKNKG